MLSLHLLTLAGVSFQVDWNSPPRSPKEFFGKFTGLPDQDKLLPRIKCNLYYYRTNYVLLILLAFFGAFLRNIGALVALGICVLGCLCLNDTFAITLRWALKSSMFFRLPTLGSIAADLPRSMFSL